MAAWARQAEKNADGAAYADAVSEYAALEWDELGAVARKAAARSFSCYFGSRLNSDLHQK
ncbi:hypothetical protein OG243_43205 [Streptomyces sp. NBC_01318]|uniref:hypothetical protein n=1 Tax=unclassified Streptomyces TaxID=2593676 RepID=UPI002E107B70|nr:hypothetical protein OG243_01340 [Streptomyces sp. NBC_01318]WSJ55734.1 hypothetical protein OG243_43205 [Streptomyces sp. NBC_01318]